MEEDEENVSITVNALLEIIDFIIKKCKENDIKDKDEAIKTIAENLITMLDYATFNEYENI